MSEGDNRSSPGNASLALPPARWRRSMDAEAVPHPACKGKHRGARRDAARGRRSRTPGDCPRASPHRLRALDATDGGTPTRPAREVSVGVRPQPAAHARAWRLVGARPRQAHVRGIGASALCLQAPLIIRKLSTPDAAHAPGAQALAAPLTKSAARWTFHKRLCRVEAAGASGSALDSASAMTARARKRRGEQNEPARPRRNLIGKNGRYMIPGIVGVPVGATAGCGRTPRPSSPLCSRGYLFLAREVLRVDLRAVFRRAGLFAAVDLRAVLLFVVRFAAFAAGLFLRLGAGM